MTAHLKQTLEQVFRQLKQQLNFGTQKQPETLLHAMILLDIQNDWQLQWPVTEHRRKPPLECAFIPSVMAVRHRTLTLMSRPSVI